MPTARLGPYQSLSNEVRLSQAISSVQAHFTICGLSCGHSFSIYCSHFYFRASTIQVRVERMHIFRLNALQRALKLHQLTLEGRIINVELTAGGGGKGGNSTS